jgi:hypothetical protein
MGKMLILGKFCALDSISLFRVRILSMCIKHDFGLVPSYTKNNGCIDK